MKAKHLMSLAAAMLILTGCMVLSVYPFYMESNVIFDPRVSGSWTNAAEANNRWVFENDGSNGYRLEYSDSKITNHIAVTLFKLHDTTFMDMMARDSFNESVQPPPIPSHMLFRVTLSQGRIKMTPMNYEWLEKLVEKNPKAIRHHIVTDPDNHESRTVVLTADTAELQKFVIKNLKTQDAWKEPFDLMKLPAANGGSK